MKNLRAKYTANFKRDYVAGSAIVIFFLIVISEIALAVSIPIYMKRENAMALAVRRLELIQTFDTTRSVAKSLKVKNETAQAEIDVIAWNLNRMAEYLRQYSKYLSGSEVAVLQQQLIEMSTVLSHLRRGVPFTKRHEIDYTPYLERVMKQSGAVQ